MVFFLVWPPFWSFLLPIASKQANTVEYSLVLVYVLVF